MSKNNRINKVKEQKNRYVYYIYMVGFVALMFILVVLSMSENSKKVQISEKNKETLSKNIKNAEKNYDSQILNRYNSTIKSVDSVNVVSNDDKVSKSKEDINNISTKKDKSRNTKKVYLTFDDGPSGNTAKILDILDKHDAKATFFVVYRKGDKNKKLYKRIVNEGHTIGVHSFTHNYKVIYSSDKAFRNDVVKLRKYIYDITGVKTNFYRFPGGSGNRVSKVDIRKCIKVLKKESMLYYDWNVENGDAIGKKLSDKQLVNNVVKKVKTKNTPIVLMHDAANKNGTVRTLPIIIKTLKKQGYEFAGISEDTPRIQQKK